MSFITFLTTYKYTIIMICIFFLFIVIRVCINGIYYPPIVSTDIEDISMFIPVQDEEQIYEINMLLPCLQSGEYIYKGNNKIAGCCTGLVEAYDNYKINTVKQKYIICAEKTDIQMNAFRVDENGKYKGPCASGLSILKHANGSEKCVDTM